MLVAPVILLAKASSGHELVAAALDMVLINSFSSELAPSSSCSTLDRTSHLDPALDFHLCSISLAVLQQRVEEASEAAIRAAHCYSDARSTMIDLPCLHSRLGHPYEMKIIFWFKHAGATLVWLSILWYWVQTGGP